MQTTRPAIQLTLANEPSATATLRRALDEVADSCGLDREARFDLKLAGTEALTNALKGAPAGHVVDVRISGCDGALDVEVVDRGRFEPRLRDDGVLEAEGGRGIPLMLALVDELEFASTGDGTRVRMRKHLPRNATL